VFFFFHDKTDTRDFYFEEENFSDYRTHIVRLQNI